MSTFPFKRVFQTWYLVWGKGPTLPQPAPAYFPEDINFLDTDITLAFPPLAPAAHPDYSIDTQYFAASNEAFLEEFFAALQKMSKLGVMVSLFPATVCENTCGGGKGEPQFIHHSSQVRASLIAIFSRTGHRRYYKAHSGPR